jgi:hypothetical protein
MAEDCAVLNSQLAMTRGDVSATQRVFAKQRRTRVCNNPTPLGGGASCGDKGEDEEFRPCEHTCRIDGTWSAWSPWSLDCNALCQRHRRRECTAPSPVNGGSACQGVDVQWRKCVENPEGTNVDNSLTSSSMIHVPAHCLPEHHHRIPENSYQDLHRPIKPAPPFLDQETLVIASLGCFAFLLMIIVLLSAMLCCRRRHSKKNNSCQGLFVDNLRKEDNIFFDDEGLFYFLFRDV